MRKLIIIAVALIVVAGGGYAIISRGGFGGRTTPTPVAPPVETVEQIVAEGRVVPVRNATLSFPTGGIVTAVLVKEGDQVAAGQVLARLDTTLQQVAVDQAEAALAEAQAADQQVRAGARPEAITAAEAQLAQAEAQLRQTTGSVTPADITAAEAQLRYARDRLARLRAGARASELRSANAALQQAQAALVTQRDQLSAAKTNAKLQLERATADLTGAQQSYASAKANWEFVRDTGQDPANPEVTDATGKKVKNKLNDTQRQLYYDAFVQGESALRNAEAVVQQMLVAYDTARQAEVSGVQQAEQNVTQASASFDQLRVGTDADQISGAQADVASAQATLSRMQGEQRDGALAAASAAAEQARANLALLQAAPRPSDLAITQARIQRAEAELRLAQLTLDTMQLKAPFAATIASVDIVANEHATSGQTIMRLADVSRWQIETTDLTELNIAAIREGAPATLTFDALPDVTLAGTVTRIRTFGENKQGDITYVVVVDPARQDAQLRWNMTAAVTITPR